MRRYVDAALLILAIAVAGCGRSGPPPELSTEQISNNAPGVFDGAPAEVRQLASDVVDAIGGQDFTTAWTKLQELDSRPELTPAQREFVAQSMASVGAEVRNAEQAGNEAAQRVLEFHRANK
jgi:hypothetical protein